MTSSVSPAGPWVEAFVVDLDDRLRSKSNFRRSSGARRSEWSEFRRFEQDTALVISQALPPTWDLGDREAPLASRPVVVAVIAARSLLDAANFSKSVLDAAQDVVFHNDASVAGTASLGVRARDDQRARIAFARLDPGASLAMVSAALAALTALVGTEFS